MHTAPEQYCNYMLTLHICFCVCFQSMRFLRKRTRPDDIQGCSFGRYLLHLLLFVQSYTYQYSHPHYQNLKSIEGAKCIHAMCGHHNNVRARARARVCIFSLSLFLSLSPSLSLCAYMLCVCVCVCVCVCICVCVHACAFDISFSCWTTTVTFVCIPISGNRHHHYHCHYRHRHRHRHDEKEEHRFLQHTSACWHANGAMRSSAARNGNDGLQLLCVYV
jgi:hypothetical protein